MTLKSTIHQSGEMSEKAISSENANSRFPTHVTEDQPPEFRAPTQKFSIIPASLLDDEPRFLGNR